MDQASGASQTAIRVAALRAAHQILNGEPKILLDPVSVGLFPQATESAIRADAERLMQAPMRRIRANFVLRSRFAEDRLAEAVARGLTQYLLLGAGLDTFAYRQPDWAQALQIVEIDHPASQAFKLASLSNAGVAIPRNVQFLGIDFACDSLSTKLGSARLEQTKPVFVSWLGVTQYLSREALAATLRTLADWQGGAEIAVTYMMPMLARRWTMRKHAPLNAVSHGCRNSAPTSSATCCCGPASVTWSSCQSKPPRHATSRAEPMG